MSHQHLADNWPTFTICQASVCGLRLNRGFELKCIGTLKVVGTRQNIRPIFHQHLADNWRTFAKRLFKADHNCDIVWQPTTKPRLWAQVHWHTLGVGTKTIVRRGLGTHLFADTFSSTVPFGDLTCDILLPKENFLVPPRLLHLLAHQLLQLSALTLWFLHFLARQLLQPRAL